MLQYSIQNTETFLRVCCVPLSQQGVPHEGDVCTAWLSGAATTLILS